MGLPNRVLLATISAYSRAAFWVKSNGLLLNAISASLAASVKATFRCPSGNRAIPK